MKVHDLLSVLEQNPDCFLCTELLFAPAQNMKPEKTPAYLSDFYLSNINPCKKDVLILCFYYDTPDYIIDKYTAGQFKEELQKSLTEKDYDRDVWCTISNLEFSVTYPDVYFAQSKVDTLKLLDKPDYRCKLFVEYHKEPVCV